MMGFNPRKAMAVLAAVAMMGVAGPVAVTAANAADAPAAVQGVAQPVTVTFHYVNLDGTDNHVLHVQGLAGDDFSEFTGSKHYEQPTLEGHVFQYWFKDLGVAFQGPVTKDVDVYPQYKEAPAAKQVTVKFTDGRGNQIVPPVSKDEGTAFSEFAEGVKAPASEGNAFKGWTADGVNTLAGDWKVTKDTEVVPLYVAAPAPSAKQLTVVFHGRDGQPGWPVEKTLDRGTVFSEFLKALDGQTLPSMPGYTLKGWGVNPDSKNAIDPSTHMDFETDVKAVYRVFEQNPVERVTVTFHGKDGQPGWPAAVTLDKGSKFYEFQNKFDKTVPTVDGFDFVGWSKDIHNVDADHLIDSLYEVTESIDAFPVYVAAEQPAPAKVNITFRNAQGGTVANIPGSAGDLFGSFASQVKAPAEPGKVFTGWSQDGKTLVEGNLAVNGDMIVTAVYRDVYQPQPQFPWWANWWTAFQHWWGSWNHWFNGWWR